MISHNTFLKNIFSILLCREKIRGRECYHSVTRWLWTSVWFFLCSHVHMNTCTRFPIHITVLKHQAWWYIKYLSFSIIIVPSRCRRRVTFDEVFRFCSSTDQHVLLIRRQYLSYSMPRVIFRSQRARKRSWNVHFNNTCTRFVAQQTRDKIFPAFRVTRVQYSLLSCNVWGFIPAHFLGFFENQTFGSKPVM